MAPTASAALTGGGVGGGGGGEGLKKSPLLETESYSCRNKLSLGNPTLIGSGRDSLDASVSVSPTHAWTGTPGLMETSEHGEGPAGGKAGYTRLQIPLRRLITR